MAGVSDAAAPLFSSCLLNAAYVCLSFFLACPSPKLHLVGAPIDQLPADLRLYDFGGQHQLDVRCLTSLVRSVHAARHVAYHYHTWCLREQSSGLADFASHTFGRSVDVEDIRVMVTDGQRLAWLEHECQNGYVGFIVAMDWPRFQATPDTGLLRLTHDVLALPSIRGLLSLLPPQWPGESFGHYHEQVVQYSLGSPRECGSLFHRLSVHCAGCALFSPPPHADPRSCVGCRRGGFLCRAVSGIGHSSPSTPSAFLSCAVDLLRRGEAKCDQLLKGLDLGVGGSAGLARPAKSTYPAGSADLTETAQGLRGHSRQADWPRLPWCGSETAQHIQMLDLILHLDQKLDRLCGQRPTAADEHGVVQAAKCRRRSAIACTGERQPSARALSGLPTLLPRVTEEDHDDVRMAVGPLEAGK